MSVDGYKAGGLRFGIFELDLDGGELRKGGISVKLQSQQIQLLTLLAERAGDVVSREEIRRALWDDKTFVDFDQSINFCVNKLRDALNDDPQSPRYIETIPRKGYRFIAPISGSDREAQVPASLNHPHIAQIYGQDSRKRIDSAAVAAFEIEDALSGAAEAPPASARTRGSRWREALPWAIVAAAVLAALGAAMYLTTRPRPAVASGVFRTEIPMPPGVWFNFVSVSPDGRKVVGGGPAQGLWIRDFGSVEWRRLPGTEDSRSAAFWSPDSRYLAFGVQNQLKKLDTLGGPPETLCTVPGGDTDGSGSWNRAGVIIFGTWGGGASGPVYKVPQSGGAATPVTEVDTSKGEVYHTWPVFLEDGKHFLYFRSGPPEVAGIYAGSLDAKPADQSRERIVASQLTAVYSSGYLFFMRGTTLMAQPFDTRSLRLTNTPIAVAERLLTSWYGIETVSVSSGGVLAYSTFAPVKSQLAWLDRHGKIVRTIGSPTFIGDGPRLSPDGTRAIVRDARYQVPGDLWTVDLSNGQRMRLTVRANDYSPGVWSPDGNRVAYTGGNFGDTIYEKSSSGVGDERELLKEPFLRHNVTDWSRDGRFLLYTTENAPKTGSDVWVLPLEGERKPVLLLGERFNEWSARFSPDMHWIAYSSLEIPGKGPEIFVRPFVISPAGKPALGDGKWQVSREGGFWEIWLSNREIVFMGDFRTSTDNVIASTVDTSGAAFKSGTPELLFNQAGAWDVTPDGQRFLYAVPQWPPQRSAPSINVVLNWPALLTK